MSEVTATLPGNLRLVFSKSLQTTGTQITSNYQINMSSPGNNIASAVLDTNSAIIYLTLSTPLNNGNYTMTVYNLADIDGNSIIENDIDNRSSFFITADNIPPVLNSAAVISSTQIRLVFSETVEQTTSENNLNYQIDTGVPGAGIASAVQNVNTNEIVITLATPLADGNHSISVSGIYDLNGNIIITDGIGNQATFSVDTTSPIVSLAMHESTTTLRLIFNEPVEQTTSETTTNYQIDANTAGAGISSVTRNLNTAEVIITLTTPLTQGSHAITVMNVQDFASNIIVNNNIGNTAAFNVPDSTPPILSLAIHESTTTLRLIFNEPVEQTTSETTTNYQIDANTAGAGISSVTRDINTTEVIITLTTPLSVGSHTITVYNVKDLNANVIINNSIDNLAGFTVADITVPTLLSVTVNSTTQLVLHFSESVDLVTSQSITNYEIDTNGAGINITAAIRDMLTTDVILTLTSSPQITEGAHTIKVINIQDSAGNAIVNNGTDNIVNIWIDTKGPVLSSATHTNGTLIYLVFSEPLDQASAETLSNYEIDTNGPGTGILTAVLQVNTTDVILTLNAPVPQGSHSVDATGVADIYGNTVADNGVDDVKSFFVDTISPVLSTVSVTGPTTLVLGFSEMLTLSTAQDKFNYKIDGAAFGTGVASVVLQPNGQNVLLTASAALSEASHSVTVINVQDLYTNVIVNNGTDNLKNFTMNYPPVLLSAVVESANRVRLVFSEAMNGASISLTGNYQVGGNPPGALISSVQLDSITSEALVYFTAPLASNTYSLVVTGVQDFSSVAIVNNGITNISSFIINTTGTFDQGAVYTDPFTDSIKDVIMFTYNDYLYAGPNATETSVFHFTHDLLSTSMVTLDGNNVLAGNQSFYNLPTSGGSPLGGIDRFFPVCIGATPSSLQGAACTSAGGTQSLIVTGYLIPGGGSYESAWQSFDTSISSGAYLGFDQVSGFDRAGACPMASEIYVFKDQLYVSIPESAGGAVRFSRACVKSGGCPDGLPYKGIQSLNGKALYHIGGGATPKNGQAGSLIGLDVMYEYDNDGAGTNPSQLYIASGGSDNDITTRILLSEINDGGILRTTLAKSTAATPPITNTDFEDVTPTHIKWLRYMSIAMPQNYGDNGVCNGNGDDWDCLVPANTYAAARRAIPAMGVAPNGDLYIIRNACSSMTVQTLTATIKQTCPSGSEVPQLWMLPKGTTAAPKGSAHWVMVAENPSANGRTDMSGNTVCGSPNKCDTENTHITFLKFNGNFLYIGFENAAHGMNIWRADMSAIASGTSPLESNFTLVSTFGLGDAVANTRIFSYTTYSTGGLDYLFVTTGNGTNSTRIFRTID